MLPEFDSFIAIDWSGATKNYGGIAVAMCGGGRFAPRLIFPEGTSRWSRSTIAHWLATHLSTRRQTERACAELTQTRPETVFKLLGSKQVGKASITGIRVLHHIRSINADRVSFWPFEKARESVIVEIYPTLFRKSSTGSHAKIRSVHDLNEALEFFECDSIKSRKDLSDHETDALLSAAALRKIAGNPAAWSHREITSRRVRREGWIFGVSETCVK